MGGGGKVGRIYSLSHRQIRASHVPNKFCPRLKPCIIVMDLCYFSEKRNKERCMVRIDYDIDTLRLLNKKFLDPKIL